MALKVTVWNVEHARKLLGANPSNAVTDRRRRVLETVQAIDPDVFCLVEGPVGEQAIADFASQVLAGGWSPVRLDPGAPLGSRDGDYRMGQPQWIWFLVKPALLPSCRLQDPALWESFVGHKTWPVHYWGKILPTRHKHHRQPQVMILTRPAGDELELIGVHLKSKINQETITRDADGNLDGAYLDEALRARVKLATEASDVRAYVDARFAQNRQPGILLLGDCNDGPGQDLFESRYLFFDLIQNLQGEILDAEKFFNHALFDFPGDLRWTARFRDEVLGLPASQNPLLLDHVLMSQPLVRGQLSLVVHAGAGKVEHEAFERANAGSNSATRTSDHRPVTLVLQENAP